MSHALRRASILLTLAAVATAAACTEVQRGLGETCLEDSDCASGLCESGRCSRPPSRPIGYAPDAAADAAPDAADAGIDAADAADATTNDGGDSGPGDASDDG